MGFYFLSRTFAKAVPTSCRELLQKYYNLWCSVFSQKHVRRPIELDLDPCLEWKVTLKKTGSRIKGKYIAATCNISIYGAPGFNIVGGSEGKCLLPLVQVSTAAFPKSQSRPTVRKKTVKFTDLEFIEP